MLRLKALIKQLYFIVLTFVFFSKCRCSESLVFFSTNAPAPSNVAVCFIEQAPHVTAIKNLTDGFTFGSESLYTYVKGATVDLSKVIFLDVLKWNVTFKYTTDFSKTLFYARTGNGCDVALSSIFMMASDDLCDANCQLPPSGFEGTSYDAYAPYVCCLDFSESFYSGGWALMSWQRAYAQVDYIQVLFQEETVNAIVVTVVCALGVAHLIWLIEAVMPWHEGEAFPSAFLFRRRYYEGLKDGVWFATSTVLGDTSSSSKMPRNPLGRLLFTLWVLFGTFLSSYITSIESSTLTTASVNMVEITALNQLSGQRVCVPVGFSETSLEALSSDVIIMATENMTACYAALRAKEVQAVFGLREEMVSLFSQGLNLNLYISPVLAAKEYAAAWRDQWPLASAFNSALKIYQEGSIALAPTYADLVKDWYQGESSASLMGGSTEQARAPINWRVLGAALGLVGVYSLLQALVMLVHRLFPEELEQMEREEEVAMEAEADAQNAAYFFTLAPAAGKGAVGSGTSESGTSGNEMNGSGRIGSKDGTVRDIGIGVSCSVGNSETVHGVVGGQVLGLFANNNNISNYNNNNNNFNNNNNDNNNYYFNNNGNKKNNNGNNNGGMKEATINRNGSSMALRNMSNASGGSSGASGMGVPLIPLLDPNSNHSSDPFFPFGKGGGPVAALSISATSGQLPSNGQFPGGGVDGSKSSNGTVHSVGTVGSSNGTSHGGGFVSLMSTATSLNVTASFGEPLSPKTRGSKALDKVRMAVSLVRHLSPGASNATLMSNGRKIVVNEEGIPIETAPRVGGSQELEKIIETVTALKKEIKLLKANSTRLFSKGGSFPTNTCSFDSKAAAAAAANGSPHGIGMAYGNETGPHSPLASASTSAVSPFRKTSPSPIAENVTPPTHTSGSSGGGGGDGGGGVARYHHTYDDNSSASTPGTLQSVFSNSIGGRGGGLRCAGRGGAEIEEDVREIPRTSGIHHAQGVTPGGCLMSPRTVAPSHVNAFSPRLLAVTPNYSFNANACLKPSHAIYNHPGIRVLNASIVNSTITTTTSTSHVGGAGPQGAVCPSPESPEEQQQEEQEHQKGLMPLHPRPGGEGHTVASASQSNHLKQLSSPSSNEGINNGSESTSPRDKIQGDPETDGRFLTTIPHGVHRSSPNLVPVQLSSGSGFVTVNPYDGARPSEMTSAVSKFGSAPSSVGGGPASLANEAFVSSFGQQLNLVNVTSTLTRHPYPHPPPHPYQGIHIPQTTTQPSSAESASLPKPGDRALPHVAPNQENGPVSGSGSRLETPKFVHEEAFDDSTAVVPLHAPLMDPVATSTAELSLDLNGSRLMEVDPMKLDLIRPKLGVSRLFEKTVHYGRPVLSAAP